MDTLEGLRRKLDGAEDIKSVVRTMKAVAASNIGQYEMAVSFTWGLLPYGNFRHYRIFHGGTN